jgi:Cu/Zn superoxide dismutase
MKRLVAAVAAVILTTAHAGAQSYPGDSGAGVQRGIQQLNNSGQVGTVTLFNAGASTRLVVELKGGPAHAQSVKLFRGPSCDDVSTGAPAYVLGDAHNGRSASAANAPESQLLSGNYNVVVFASNRTGARATACGHLYAS